MGFNKQERRGVVVLANSENDIDDIGWHLLNPKFKLKDTHTRQVAKIDYRVYDDYVGRYKFMSGGGFVITRDGDHIFSKLMERPTIKVYPESEKEFLLIRSWTRN